MKRIFILVAVIIFSFMGIGFCADGFYVIPVVKKPHKCGAYITQTIWKIFDCYNLAAIGKTTSDDPFTPSWRLIGGYWQWGRKGPSSSTWYNTNTKNFAHGPTGPDSGDANDGSISGWDTGYAADSAWSDLDCSYPSKSTDDPCPKGFRVPTESQWMGVMDNNRPSTVGTWTNSVTNYSSAWFFGDDLMLPAAGSRDRNSGSLYSRGEYGYYWSSTEWSGTDKAWYLYFHSSSTGTDFSGRRYGNSVRCVAE